MDALQTGRTGAVSHASIQREYDARCTRKCDGVKRGTRGSAGRKTGIGIKTDGGDRGSVFRGGGQPSYLDKHFCKSLAAALAEDYPWHEVIVPVFGGSIPQEFVRNALNSGVRLCLPEHLCSAARGNYVEWLLPGDIPRREKLRNMITCAELQDWIYPILLSEARSGVLEMSPMVNFGVSAKENCRMISCEAAWSWLLLQGKVPSRGMAGVLVKKSVFDDCRGLVDCFEAGRPHVFLMWRELLLAGGEQMEMQMCVMHEDETESGAELHLEELAAHQLDWHALCILDRALLSKETQEEILNRQRRIGIYLLEHAIDEGVDLQLGIWPEYQQMLMTL